jgi:hypothetical protein
MTITSETRKQVNPNVGRPVQVLLVEDSPSDAAMTIEAMHEGRMSTRCTLPPTERSRWRSSADKDPTQTRHGPT